ncbi:hypothetical protein BH10CYA1_BH10CYA1_15330 [soil metagenome]
MKIVKIGMTIAALSLCLSPYKAYCCGPFFDETVFSYQFHPDIPLKFFADGKLGVLEPSFARSYLFSAYRELSGKPLTTIEQTSIVKFWETRMTNGDALVGDSNLAVDRWLAERNKIPGFKKIDRISADRSPSLSEDDTNISYLNCPEDAFNSATTTLKEKVTKYGASSKAVKDWVAAQDDVFNHCPSPNYKWETKKYDPEPPYPASAPANADAATKADRSYQIAAANFYGQKFDQAAQEFDAIAKDESSPYHSIAPYLAARCMVRKGSLPKKYDISALQNAQQRLKLVLDDTKTSTEIRDSAKNLLNFIAIRQTPDQTLKELSNKLTSGGANNNFGQDLTDYTYMLDKFFGWNVDNDTQDPVKLSQVPKSGQTELTEWITLVQSVESTAEQLAVHKWNETRSPLWLVPAIMHAKVTDKDSAALIDAALNVPASSSAFLTVRYYALKLLVQSKDNARAHKVISEVLANKNLPPSSMNLFLDQKAKLATTLSGYWPDAVRVSSGAINDSAGVETPDDFDQAEARTSWYVGPSAFSPAAANVINEFIPLNVLTTASWNNWALAQRRDFLQAVWTRAVLLNDDKVVAQVTPLLAAQNPLLTKLLNEYKTVTNPDQKRFLSIYILLMDPAMRPYITPGTLRQAEFNKIEDYQDNWWCATGAPNKDKDSDPAKKMAKFKPAFLNAAQLAQAAAEDQRLIAVGSGSTYLLTELIAYTKKAGAKDKRLPEALYHAIRSPKFACTDKTTSVLSKTAFQILHKEFPHNPWTDKTQYWY